MRITCTQKNVYIKSNTVQNTMVITCIQKKVKIMSNTIQNTMVVTCMKKKVKIKSNSIQNIMMFWTGLDIHFLLRSGDPHAVLGGV